MTWRAARDYAEIKELFELLEPPYNVWDREGLWQWYKVFVTTDGTALALVAWLPVTGVVHIETFGLHPRIRGQGRARGLFAALLAHVHATHGWPTDKLLIEVYVENVEAWRKIMGVTEVDVGDMRPFHVEDPMVIMGKGVDRTAYEEWQRMQWAGRMKQ